METTKNWIDKNEINNLYENWWKVKETYDAPFAIQPFISFVYLEKKELDPNAIRFSVLDWKRQYNKIIKIKNNHYIDIDKQQELYSKLNERVFVLPKWDAARNFRFIDTFPNTYSNKPITNFKLSFENNLKLNPWIDNKNKTCVEFFEALTCFTKKKTVENIVSTWTHLLTDFNDLSTDHSDWRKLNKIVKHDYPTLTWVLEEIKNAKK